MVIDVGPAAFALAVSVLLVATHGFGSPDPSSRGLDLPGMILAATAAVPLLVRRRFPCTVYVVVAAATVTLVRFDYALDIPIGVLLAIHPLAAAFGGDAKLWRRWAVIGSVALFVPVTVAAYALRGGHVDTILPAMAFWAAVIAGTWIAGDRSRLQAERLGSLEERAIRAEQAVEQDRRLAAAEERTRIARELHDSAGHAINVILVQAGAARMLFDRDPAGSRRSIGTIEDVARGTIIEIDRLVRALREDRGIEPPAPVEPTALDELLDRHRDAGLSVSSAVHGKPRLLQRGVALAAHRILQEALTNAARHGQGCAEVVLAFRPDELEITVTNPIGSRSGTASCGGHGIVGMHERATLLGGKLDAGPHGGTFRLHALLPERRSSP
ncbi:histidine kinase [Kribbella sp. VKM Ac-2571]|nr:histidine kinase [Kribbella sp. VKM Ac-2571]